VTRLQRAVASLGFCVVLTACAGGPQPADQNNEEAPATLAALGNEAVVSLDTATVREIGIRTLTLSRAVRPAEVELPAEIVEDPGARTTVRAGVGGRLRPAAGAHWPRVGELLGAGAPLAQIGDALPVDVPRGGTVVGLQAQPGELVQPGQALIDLIDYSAPLARVTWSGPAVPPPQTLPLAPMGGGARVDGRFQGPAPDADPVTGGAAYLYRIPTGGSTLRPGTVLLAFLPDPASHGPGIEVPDRAVVQWDALAWVYVERAPGKFVRVRIPTNLPIPGGWRVEEGLHPGDRIVVTGAGQLLSEEFRARIVVGEEVGE